MPLPDSETLKGILTAATSGPWLKVAADHTMWEGDETPPFDIVGHDGKVIANNAAFYPEAVTPENGALIALAPELAEEVIQLREEAIQLQAALADPDVAQYRNYLAKSRALASGLAPIRAAFEAGDESQREPFLDKLEEFLLVESIENERRTRGILMTSIAESQISTIKFLTSE
jgi:hypothetical protein